MAKNDTLERLKEIASLDEYDAQAGRIVKHLQEQWDLAVAAENLGEHLIIKAFVKDIQQEVDDINELLRNQTVKNDNDIKIRFKLQADKEAFIRIIDIFSGAKKQQVDKLIVEADARAKNQGN